MFEILDSQSSRSSESLPLLPTCSHTCVHQELCSVAFGLRQLRNLHGRPALIAPAVVKTHVLQLQGEIARRLPGQPPLGPTDPQAKGAIGDEWWAQGDTVLGPLDAELLTGLRQYHLTGQGHLAVLLHQ